jgi:hypothetical protein
VSIRFVRVRPGRAVPSLAPVGGSRSLTVAAMATATTVLVTGCGKSHAAGAPGGQSPAPTPVPSDLPVTG